MLDRIFDVCDLFIKFGLLGLHHLNVFLTSFDLVWDDPLVLSDQLLHLLIELALLLTCDSDHVLDALFLVFHLRFDDFV